MSNFKFIAPVNAVFMRINVLHDNVVTLEDITKVEDVVGSTDKDPISAVASNWKGKKIAWYGTSIPAGSPENNQQDIWSHANLAVKDLGATIINKAVPSGCISTGGELSFVRTTDAINYQNSLIALIGTESEPDLVVFDYGVNDFIYGNKASINSFDPTDPLDLLATGTKTRIDSRDINTFIGAYNTIIDAMLTKKPTLKFCFFTHFSNDNAHPVIESKERFYASTNENIEGLAKYWSAPVFKVYEKSNFRNRNGFNSITPLMPDGVHPASGDGRAVQSLRNIVRGFLQTIS